MGITRKKMKQLLITAFAMCAFAISAAETNTVSATKETVEIEEKYDAAFAIWGFGNYGMYSGYQLTGASRPQVGRRRTVRVWRPRSSVLISTMQSPRTSVSSPRSTGATSTTIRSAPPPITAMVETMSSTRISRGRLWRHVQLLRLEKK